MITDDKFILIEFIEYFYKNQSEYRDIWEAWEGFKKERK
jgi:hypothetical protein